MGRRPGQPSRQLEDAALRDCVDEAKDVEGLSQANLAHLLAGRPAVRPARLHTVESLVRERFGECRG